MTVNLNKMKTDKIKAVEKLIAQFMSDYVCGYKADGFLQVRADWDVYTLATVVVEWFEENKE